jgi:hypothetical protein
MKIAVYDRLKHGVSLVVLFAAMFFSQNSLAQQAKINQVVLNKTIMELDASYASGTILSSVVADKALTEAEIAQEELQIWFLQEEANCYERFFVTVCLNKNKLRKRNYQSILQRITVEAKAFQRKEHIEQIDADLELKKKQLPAN